MADTETRQLQMKGIRLRLHDVNGAVMSVTAVSGPGGYRDLTSRCMKPIEWMCSRPCPRPATPPARHAGVSTQLAWAQHSRARMRAAIGSESPHRHHLYPLVVHYILQFLSLIHLKLIHLKRHPSRDLAVTVSLPMLRSMLCHHSCCLQPQAYLQQPAALLPHGYSRPAY